MRKEIVLSKRGFEGATDIAELVQLANQYSSNIYFFVENKKINVKSIMGMMSLVLRDGDGITIYTEGSDEKDALLAMEDFLLN